VEQVNKAITQMDEVTQQNAALVEEAAAAAQALQDQSANLQSQLERYTVGGEKAASTVARPARAVAKVPERRQASRPWNGPKKTPRASEPTRSAERPSAKAVGGDSEWQEF
jgi:methyl-accepting chemotaxis protein